MIAAIANIILMSVGLEFGSCQGLLCLVEQVELDARERKLVTILARLAKLKDLISLVCFALTY